VNALPLRLSDGRAAAQALHVAMAAYLALYGFSALRIAVAELEADLARQNRAQLAQEGWIA